MMKILERTTKGRDLFWFMVIDVLFCTALKTARQLISWRTGIRVSYEQGPGLIHSPNHTFVTFFQLVPTSEAFHNLLK